MKTLLVSLCVLGFSSFLGAVSTAQVDYVEGEAVLRPSAGAQRELLIGDALRAGDTIRTGKSGLVELKQAGVILKMSSSTVFTLLERELNGQTRAVVVLALGSLKMKYDKISGHDPLIRTISCQAAVRGTELTVVSGADGSSIIAVDSGAVEVSAEGKAVSLSAGQGVEVGLGKAPGKMFELQRNLTDYRTWDQEKLMSMRADPLASLAAARSQMDAYVQNVRDYQGLYEKYYQKLLIIRQEFEEIFKTKGKEAAEQFSIETLLPLTVQTGNLVLNTRFNAIAALSLRRYVIGRLYVLVKPDLLVGNPTWAAEYRASHAELVSYFEVEIAPHLAESDL